MWAGAAAKSVGGGGCGRALARQRSAPMKSANSGLRLGSARQASIPFARSVSSRARSYGAVVNRRRANHSLGGPNLLGQHAVDRNQEATVYVGNLDPQVRRQSRPKSRPEFEKPSGSIAPPPRYLLTSPSRTVAQVTEEIVWEVFVQAGPVVNVYMPKDRVIIAHQGYAFVEYRGEEDADYAIKVLNMIKLFGKPIRANKASVDKKSTDVGANLFVGNLDPT